MEGIPFDRGSEGSERAATGQDVQNQEIFPFIKF